MKSRWGLILVLLLALFAGSSSSWADISVHIDPAEAVTAGAQWRADGGTWRSSGEAETGQ